MVAYSNSCQLLPKTLNFPNATYHLKEENTTLEPGMKIAYLKCENGKFRLGDDGPGVIIVYSNGNPKLSRDVIVFGNWGRALYSFENKDK